jgi:uncharacterized protein (TIGR03435 family)
MRFLMLAVAVLPALAQPAAFDAVSIKSAAHPEGTNEPIRQSTPGRVTYRNYSLRLLLTEAYHLTRYQVDGPAWIEEDRYDVMASKPPATTAEQERPMLQGMLAERFHIVQHFEEREIAAYALLAGKDKSKLQAVKSGEAKMCKSSGTMAEFADLLATIIQEPVVDQTGIFGRYYFVLVLSGRSPVRTLGLPMGRMQIVGPLSPPLPPPAVAATGCEGWTGEWSRPESSAFEAVREQMGLRLERRGTQAVNVMVLDRVEKPSPN